MALNITSTNVYLLPGMSIKVLAELDVFSSVGEFAFMDELTVNDEKKDLALTNGFYLENEDVGTLTVVENEPAVIYTHKKPEKNSIWFVARIGAGTRRGVCNVMSVPIHDHSSIVQGGPAYGTYFSDDEADEE
jgi:hypothetical protein